MDSKHVSRLLEEIAAMLELGRENPFKVKAYENASRAILGFSGDLAEAVRTGNLRDLRGIGDAIFANIQTLVATGRLPYHEELCARFPPGLRDCLRVPGLGAAKVDLLHRSLGIDSLEALERACREGRLAQVKGFGAKSIERILRGIATVRAGTGLHRISRPHARAGELAQVLLAAGAGRVEIAGALRRRCELVREIALVACAGNPEKLLAVFRGFAGVAETLESGPRSTRVRLTEGIAAELAVVPEVELPAEWLFATGSDEHVASLAALAEARGFRLDRTGLFDASGARRSSPTETAVYEALGLQWVPPELREATGEIQAAAAGALPRLVEAEDLRGLIHVHTLESDGRDSLEDMVGAARDGGYGYVAITDHSTSAAYAGGLTEDRVLAQRAAIRRMAGQFPGFRIFHGTEADILADGSIDFGDDFLDGFDIVVASVHSRFGLPRGEQTRRLIRAVRNPRVSVLGHPSGRLLLSRDPIDVDMAAVLRAAGETGCAVEVNCNPQRLDLDWRLCREAAAAGVLLSIDPDAHSVAELGLIPYGLGIARKGWVTPASVLNARNADELADWLARRRGKPLPG